MEYYKLWLSNKRKYLIIIGHHDFDIYNENMELEKRYSKVWNNALREKFIEKATLVIDENELAKLMLICHT